VIDPEDKLQALFHFGNLVVNDPPKVMLLGFLAGRVERLHFVEDLEGAPTQIFMSARRYPIMPTKDFEATVNGVKLATPVHIMRALGETHPEIALRLDFDGMHRAPWYRQVVVSSLYDEDIEATTVEQRIEELKERVDQTLDLYNEIRSALQAGTNDEREQLEFFLTRARNEMQDLSTQLQRLQAFVGETERSR